MSSHGDLFAPLYVPLEFEVPLDGVRGSGLEFDACDALLDGATDAAALDAAAAAAGDEASAALKNDPRIPALIKKQLVSLPAPILSFSISGSTPSQPSSITAALAECAGELNLDPEARNKIHQAAVLVLEEVAQQQLQMQYTQVLLRELQQGNSTAAGSLHRPQRKQREESDSIGHWENEDDEAQEQKQQQQSDATATPHRSPAAQPSGLAAWKQAKFLSTGSSLSALSASDVAAGADLAAPARSSPPHRSAASSHPSLGSLISTLLAAATVPASSAAAGKSPSLAGMPSYLLTADSPLSKLYQLSTLYHTEHLVYLAKKQASYTALGAEQSREMDIICQQAQQSEIEGASMHGMETAAPEHATAAASGASTTLSRSSSSSSTSSASANSASALSEAISLLVQSHLSQSAYLEDLWESRLEAWCASQRRKFFIYLRDTLDEFLDRSAREREALGQHQAVQARLALQEDRRKSAKILMSEQEEAEEEARAAQRAREARGPHPLELITVYSADGAGSEAMDRILLSKLPSEMVNPLWQPSPPAVDEKALAAARAQAIKNAASASASSSMPSPLSIAAGPPAPVPPFPLQAVLAARSVYLGPASQAPARPLQLFLTNDPLFIPNSQAPKNPAAVGANANGGAASSLSASSGATPAAAAAVPLSSSPLISLNHFVSTLDALHGPYGPGGLAAMILPHHCSPLMHAAYSEPGSMDASHTEGSSGAEDEATVDLDAININSLPTSLPSDSPSRRAREKALNAFSSANRYVKNLLQYCRAQNDLLCDDLANQIRNLERELIRMHRSKNGAAIASKPPTSNAASSSLDDDLLGSSSSTDVPPAAAPPSPPPLDSLLSHGDVLLTKHGHLLNAQLLFHVNVLPRRGGAGAAAAAAAAVAAASIHNSGSSDSPPPSSNGSVSGVVMNDAELKQQVCFALLSPVIATLFSVLSHLLSLSMQYNLRVVSLPLLWDNILLSMWTTSGNYVGFGWRDADAYAAAGLNGGSASPNSSLQHVESNRQEELEVYQCMVKYLESHCRCIKQVLASLPPSSPLQSIVFYLPAQASVGGGAGAGAGGMHGAAGGGVAAQQHMGGLMLDLDASSTHGAALLHDSADDAHGGLSAASLSNSAASASSSNQHPFLAKCKAIFAEVFGS